MRPPRPRPPAPRILLHGPARAALVGAVILTFVGAGPASAFVVATSGEPGCEPGVDADCDPLRWPQGEPIPFRLHSDGGPVPDLLWEDAVRDALAQWAGVDGADLRFEEGAVFVGDPCPDGPLPEGAGDYDEHCAGRTEDVDFESVFSFLTETWPFGPEVIAQTTVSWDSSATLVDADIAFNAVYYEFTTGDDGVRTDLLSILTHETGHMLGLAHSADSDATMFAVYEQGQTHLRSLEDDDREGIRWLYPCDDEPCEGGVTWESNCSMAGGPAPWILAAVPVLGLTLRRSRRRRESGATAPAGALPLAVIAGAAALLAAPEAPRSAMVLPMALPDLYDAADLVVRAHVRDRVVYERGIVRHRVDLDVADHWKGLPPPRFSLDLAGGVLPHRGTLAFGTPALRPGDDVVLFLRWPGGGTPSVVALAAGALHLQSDGTVHRDLRGLAALSAPLPPVPSVRRDLLQWLDHRSALDGGPQPADIDGLARPAP